MDVSAPLVKVAWSPSNCHSRQSGQDTSTESTQPTLSTLYAELLANAALTLITVAGYLLDKQIQALASSFEHEGCTLK